MRYIPFFNHRRLIVLLRSPFFSSKFSALLFLNQLAMTQDRVTLAKLGENQPSLFPHAFLIIISMGLLSKFVEI